MTVNVAYMHVARNKMEQTERRAKIQQLQRENRKRNLLPKLFEDLERITGNCFSEHDLLPLSESDQLGKEFAFLYRYDYCNNQTSWQVALSETSRLDHFFAKLSDQVAHSELCIRFYHYNVGFLRLPTPDLLGQWAALLDWDGDEILIHQLNTSNCVLLERSESHGLMDGQSWIIQVCVSGQEWQAWIQK